MVIYTNGIWVDAEQAVVPFNDQGFLYGDSLFETIRVNQGQAFRLPKHLERMRSGMKTIRLAAEALLVDIPGILADLVSKNKLTDALVRVIITRGVSHSGFHNMNAKPALYLSARGISDIPVGPVKVIFLKEQDYPILRFYPAIKSGNYLGNMLAKQAAEAAGAFEPVFVNRDGYVTECAIRNIFFIQDGLLLTPAAELGVLPGVMRDTVMELAKIRGLKVREALIFYDDIDQMQEAFISSTGVGVLPVTWSGYESDYPITDELREDLNKLFESGAIDVT